MEFLAFPNIDPVALTVGPLVIRWYALAYVGGIVLGYLLLHAQNKRDGFFSQSAKDDLIFYAVLGIIIGGRLGFVLFYHPLYFFQHPLEIFQIWQGGMAFHGGIIGVIIAFYLHAKKHGLPFLGVTDRIAFVAPIGLCLGRIANFINGELYGRIALDVPWAMVFPDGGPLPRHPSQLYQSATEGLLLFIVLAIVVYGFRGLKKRGLLSGVFLMGYGTARFTIEFFREPDAHLGFIVAHLSMGQLLCMPMVVLGAWLVARRRKTTI
jgi:phosphatidylglycerol:prolipoprotein diacylglycerol transferase